MAGDLLGIHHVTSIAGAPQRNVDVFAGLLGLRLVKLTVNFDDPGTYHLYYGDEVGRPGTAMTFFPWPHGRHGQIGTGQVTVTAFSVPAGALDYWIERFERAGIAFAGPTERFDAEVLAFADPDGLQYELVAHAGAEERPCWADGPVPAQYAVRGFHSVTLAVAGYERTAAVLTEVLGFRLVRQDGQRFRFAVGPGAAGALVDLLVQPDAPRGHVAVGTVHHVAFRTADDADQAAWRQHIAAAGFAVTPVMDRQYFRSIYFREPGGVLFEIATDPPGFTRDESVAELGSRLRLPPWLEPHRAEVEGALPRLRLPTAGAAR